MYFTSYPQDGRAGCNHNFKGEGYRQEVDRAKGLDCQDELKSFLSTEKKYS